MLVMSHSARTLWSNFSVGKLGKTRFNRSRFFRMFFFGTDLFSFPFRLSVSANPDERPATHTPHTLAR